MKLDTHHWKFRRKRRRMRSLLLPGPDCLIRNKPSVPPVSHVPNRPFPSSNITLVLVWHTHRRFVKLNISFFSELKNILMTSIHETFTVDGFEVSNCNGERVCIPPLSFPSSQDTVLWKPSRHTTCILFPNCMAETSQSHPLPRPQGTASSPQGNP